MKQTNADLKRYYRIANQLYFNNKLPHDLPVFYGRTRTGVLGTTLVQGKLAHRIKISNRLRAFHCLSVMTMLHEMLHVEKPTLIGHDWRFDRRMLRLAKLGAFDGLW